MREATARVLFARRESVAKKVAEESGKQIPRRLKSPRDDNPKKHSGTDWHGSRQALNRQRNRSELHGPRRRCGCAG